MSLYNGMGEIVYHRFEGFQNYKNILISTQRDKWKTVTIRKLSWKRINKFLWKLSRYDKIPIRGFE